jgi:hypothetical protein
MVERYRNAVFTPASNSRLKDQPSSHWRGLGFGVSLEPNLALVLCPMCLKSCIRSSARKLQVITLLEACYLAQCCSMRLSRLKR